MQVELRKGIICNQELFQSCCRVIPQIVLRNIEYDKRVDACEMSEDAADGCVIDVVGFYIELLQLAVLLHLLVIDHFGEDVHASPSYFVVGEVDASHSAKIGDDQIAQIRVDVVVGQINLLEHFYLFDDLCHGLYRQPASEPTVLEIQDRLLPFELDHLR